MIIWLDPGHGGENHGCRSADGLKEEDQTLELAFRIFERSTNTYMSRMTDETLSFEARANAAKEHKATFAVVLHFDKSKSSAYASQSVYEVEPYQISINFIKGLRTHTPKWINKVVYFEAVPAPHWTGNAYNCLRDYYRHSIPAVLVEAAAFSNLDHVKQVRGNGLDDLADQITEALNYVRGYA